MTAHIIMTTFVLFVFLFMQIKMQQKKLVFLLQSLLNSVIIFTLLPFSIPLIAIIADFFFEGFSSNLTWFILLCIPAWSMSAFYVWKNRKLQSTLVQKIWSVYMCLALLMACVCALLTSHYESGPTPKLTDSYYLIGYFISIHVTLIITFILQIIFLTKSDFRSISSWICGLPMLLAIIIYVAGLFDFILSL